MNASRYTNTNIQTLIDLLNGSRVKNKDGNYSYEAFQYKRFITLLYDLINIPKGIPEMVGREILSKTVLTIGKEKLLEKRKLLREINIRINEHLSLPIMEYRLITSLSIKTGTLKTIINIGDNKIFVGYPPEKELLEERTKIISDYESTTSIITPKDYSMIIITSKGRTAHEAGEDALEKLEILRALWNYLLNQKFSIRISYGMGRQYINKILLGPIHTLHQINPHKEVQSYWFEPVFQKTNKLFEMDGKFNELQTSYNKIRKMINKLPYSDVIYKSLINYSKALDNLDYSTGYLQLWSVLESLTDTGNQNYETTIRRASFIYKDSEIMTQILNVLRLQRNKIVHINESSYQIEYYLFELKNSVELLLRFHYAKGIKCKDIHEASRILDLPRSTDVINEQIKIRNYAKRFRSK